MLRETVFHLTSQYGYPMIFSLLVLGIIGIPVPDETLLAFLGYLVHKGDLRGVPTFGAAFLGSISGITLSFVIGRTGGVSLLKRYGHRIHITEDRVERAENWYARKGKWSLVFCYFIPGVRHLIALVAGMSRLKFSTFARFAYAGGLIWSITFILMGYYGGEEWARVSEKTHEKIVIGIGIFLALILSYYFLWWIRERQRKKTT
jgi:membrane protein DedA with SNARE-associated domain